MLPCSERPHPYDLRGAEVFYPVNPRLMAMDKGGNVFSNIEEPGVDPFVVFDIKVRFGADDPHQGPYTCLYDEGKIYRLVNQARAGGTVFGLELEREVLLDKDPLDMIERAVKAALISFSKNLA
jgi:hypothetical protein